MTAHTHCRVACSGHLHKQLTCRKLCAGAPASQNWDIPLLEGGRGLGVPTLTITPLRLQPSSTVTHVPPWGFHCVTSERRVVCQWGTAGAGTKNGIQVHFKATRDPVPCRKRSALRLEAR